MQERPTSPRGRLLGGACAALAAALVWAGCGADDGAESPAVIAPPDAPLYVEAELRPGAEVSRRLDEFAARLSEELEPGVGTALSRAFERASIDEGFSFDADVEPWLGDTIGIALRGFDRDEVDIAAIAQVDDEDAAEDAIERISGRWGDSEEREHRGVEYVFDEDGNRAIGLVEGLVVFASDGGMRATVDAAEDGGLAELELFDETMAELEGGALGRAFLDLDRLVEDGVSSRGLDAPTADLLRTVLGISAGEPVTLALDVDEIGLVAELAAGSGSILAREGSEVVAEAPAGSWLSTLVPDAGARILELLPTIGRLVQEEGLPIPEGSLDDALRLLTGSTPQELVGWVGDATVWARSGEDGLELGAVAEVTDVDQARRSVRLAGDRLTALGRLGGISGIVAIEDGFVIETELGGAPIGAEIVLRGDRLVVGPIEGEGLAVAGELGDDPRFEGARDALGAGLDTFLVPRSIERLAGGKARDGFARAALEALGRVAWIASSGTSDGERWSGRIVIAGPDDG